MKLVIFGAAGRTGQLVVERALRRGHQLTAVARRTEGVWPSQEELTVVEGDACEAEVADRAIAGADAIISVLGPRSNEKVSGIELATRMILRKMGENGVDRLVVTTGAGVADPEDQPSLLHHAIVLMLRLFLPNVHRDMERTVAAVRSSQVNWTIVRVPRLIDQVATGRVRAGRVGAGAGVSVTRSDLAAFLLDVVETGTHLRQAPVVSN